MILKGIMWYLRMKAVENSALPVNYMLKYINIENIQIYQIFSYITDSLSEGGVYKGY